MLLSTDLIPVYWNDFFVCRESWTIFLQGGAAICSSKLCSQIADVICKSSRPEVHRKEAFAERRDNITEWLVREHGERLEKVVDIFKGKFS